MASCPDHGVPRPDNDCPRCATALRKMLEVDSRQMHLGDARDAAARGPAATQNFDPRSLFETGELPPLSMPPPETDDINHTRADYRLRVHRWIIRCARCKALVRTRRRPGEELGCPACKERFTIDPSMVEQESADDLTVRPGMRACPWCAEDIPRAEQVCRHCRRQVDV